MSGSDCSLHPRSKACALCVIFCFMINVHSSRLGSPQESGHRIARSTSTDAEGDHGSKLDSSGHSIGQLGHGSDHQSSSRDRREGNLKDNLFLKEIFEKYGQDGVISFEGFQNLVRNLHIGSMVRGYGENEDPHLEGGNERAQHHYEHHMGDYDDYEYHHNEHEKGGNKGASEKAKNSPSIVHSVREKIEPHTTGQHVLELETRAQSNGTELSTYERSDHDHHGHDSHESHDHINNPIHSKPTPIPSSQPTIKNPNPKTPEEPNTPRALDSSVEVDTKNLSIPQQTLRNESQAQNQSYQTKTKESDTHDFGTQGRFRTRRLSSLRQHRSQVSPGDHRPIQGPSSRGRNKRHPLRHRHQRLSSNRNVYKPLTASDDDTEHTVVKRRKRQADPNHLQCLSPISLLNMHRLQLDSPLTEEDFISICPALIQQIDAHVCIKPRPRDASSAHAHIHSEGEEEDGHAHHDHEDGHNHTHPQSEYHVSQVTGEVWGYALLSVVVISMAGLLGVAVVPIMQKVFYNHLLQFLVALAIGTLTGDALLHLIPHALSAAHSHGPSETEVPVEDGEDQHLMATWRSLVVLGGVYLFFITERLMEIITTKRRQTEKNRVRTTYQPDKKNNGMGSPIKLYRTVEEHESEVGAKLSKHSDAVTSCEEIVMVVHPGKEMRNMAEDMHEELHRDCEPEEREQLNHSHTVHSHGHSHGPLPQSISAVAWMVIMGDGIHNFSDGLAIGAAFANSLPGGLSTTVAVFCHELPHEIGDFAVLLRAGMTVKQAMMYNCVSSILCLFGMIVGVCVGNIGSVSLWIFALAGGMFIYIALVDMLPELKAINPRKGENPFVHFGLQNLGMLTGVAIMLLIALYVDKLKISLSDEP